MVHRDLKIGLVLGLILVIGIVIKLATNPRLNPEARIMQLDNSASPMPFVISNPDSNDSNNVTREYALADISKQTASSEQIKQENLPFSKNANENTVSQLAPAQEPTPGSENIFQKMSDETTAQLPSGANTPSFTGIDYSNFDYDSAEEIKAERFHIVGKKETLSEISNFYYHSPNEWRKILEANPEIQDPNKIKPGMKLIIPWE
jgi:nucleoid-associated protein YgaU